MKKTIAYPDKCYFKDCKNKSELSNYFQEDGKKFWVHICAICHSMLVNDERPYIINYYSHVPESFRGVDSLEWKSMPKPEQLSLF